MVRFPSLASTLALLFLLHSVVFAQTAPASGQAPSISDPEQTGTVLSSEDKLQYFVLEHRSPDQIHPADADLLKKRMHDVLAEAEFYGYDMSAGGWSNEQAVCPMMPEYIMLHYASKDAAGADSTFTVLVPRHGGRVWIVPVLNHGATRFKPAPVDPRNYQLFGQVVPGDLALKNSGPEGKWLALSVCYAEMTGAHPQVPHHPSLDIHMIKAIPPTLRIAVGGKEHQVSFADPVSPADYRLWNITYNNLGRITDVSDDQHSFGEPVVRTIPEPTPKLTPQPPDPPQKTIPASQMETPSAKVTQPSAPTGKIVTSSQMTTPVSKVIPQPSASPVKNIPSSQIETPTPKVMPQPPTPQGKIVLPSQQETPASQVKPDPQ